MKRLLKLFSLCLLFVIIAPGILDMVKEFILIIVSLNLIFGLKIGFLVPGTSPSPGFPNAYSTEGVILLARQEILNRSKINASVSLRDTRCDEGLAMVRAYDLVVTQKVDVLLGPACSNGKSCVIILPPPLLSYVNISAQPMQTSLNIVTFACDWYASNCENKMHATWIWKEIFRFYYCYCCYYKAPLFNANTVCLGPFQNAMY